MGIVDRAFLLSHPRFHRENLTFIISVLLNNDYPLEMIFNTINSRLNYLISKVLNNKNRINNNEVNDKEKKN